MSAARDQLRRWFLTTLQALDPRTLMHKAWFEPNRRKLKDFRSITVLALGKAAVPMLCGWHDAAQSEGFNPTTLRIVLAGPVAPSHLPFPAHIFVGGHPEPNAASLQAGAAMLQAARNLAAGPTPGLLVALVSGGGSALVELPALGDLEALRRRNRILVQSGAGISEINLVRKHFSLIKGGRLALAAYAPGVYQTTWILSDVAGDHPNDVSSGPTLPDSSTRAEFLAACHRWLPGEPVPEDNDPVPPQHPVFSQAGFHVLASGEDACNQLAALALAQGYETTVDHSVDEEDWELAARHLARRWRELRARQARPCLIAGGEVRVHVPSTVTGRGGRNQQLALRVALELEDTNFAFLSAGTDGADGNSDAAGAIVDGGTARRARQAGWDPVAALESFNAYPVLEASGDLLLTGPTGNNLRDLRCFLPA